MRGVILAGGTGSRLMPLTKAINKHLLPVGGKPMIHWPLKVLRDNGITDITIVSSPEGIGQIAKVMGSGSESSCKFAYRIQEQSGGIAQALAAAEDDGGEPVAVILGDNVFLPSPIIDTQVFSLTFLYEFKEEKHLRELGVAAFNDSRMIAEIVEKPQSPPSSYASTGLYVFGDYDLVRPKLARLDKGRRGEYEITDLLNMFAHEKRLSFKICSGFWGDAGTPEGLAACDKACREFA